MNGYELVFPSNNHSICFQLLSVAFIFCRAPVAQVRSWEFPRGNLAIERVIGNGAFGVVSKAYARDLPDKPEWTVVAVKSLQGNLEASLTQIFFFFKFTFPTNS